ncbi:hypothetical protein ACQR3P_04510 [Rhodococcus sp. IEGM1300]|uniref:Lipoprotein n=1 Tax=Pseudomonas arsenicoxydans TaxID=702115 RepID=A0A4P6G725_9PSED|nr:MULTISPECIES: hypothetical protein [Pseudomonas]KAA0987302.1 hypothetical protein FQ192_21960 [Pseudomonas sp. ANT_J12]QAY86106.1 hypothetical protein CUN61_19905 [Pseudomonas arsenicoxydans]
MKMNILLGLMCACLAGCGHAPTEKTVTTPDSIENLNQPRIKVPVTAKDDYVTKTKALTGLEGDGWVFDPLYATAVNTDRRDLAVCGFARQRGTTNSVYFAYYSGELILSDDKAPSGVSVENEFLTMICSHS